MNSFGKTIIGTVVKWALTLLTGGLIAHGIIDNDTAAQFVLEMTAALVPLLWALYTHYTHRQKFVTALATDRPVSESTVEQIIKTHGAPPVTTPKHDIPPAVTHG